MEDVIPHLPHTLGSFMMDPCEVGQKEQIVQDLKEIGVPFRILEDDYIDQYFSVFQILRNLSELWKDSSDLEDIQRTLRSAGLPTAALFHKYMLCRYHSKTEEPETSFWSYGSSNCDLS